MGRAHLNGKQARFVEEYLIDLNATAAALRSGYSAKSATRLGLDLLSKPHVAHAIHAAKAERSQRTEIAADQVLLELAALAFSDLREVLTWGPEGVALRPSDTLSARAAKSVQEASCTAKTRTTVQPDGAVVTTIEVQTKLRLHNKVPALLALAQHLDLLRPWADYELANQAFIHDFIPVVLKYVVDESARAELRAVLEAHVQHPCMRRTLGPVAAPHSNGHPPA